jgi:hypothetical protein
MCRLKRTTQPVGLGVVVASICLMLAVPGLPVAATFGSVIETAHAPWQAVADTPQGQIYHRDVAGSSLPETMIVTRLDAPPARVHALVTDYGHFAEFIPNVAESRVLLQAGGRQWVFHHLHFAGPVADRAYVIESTDAASRPQENYYRVEWELSDRDFPGSEGQTGEDDRPVYSAGDGGSAPASREHGVIRRWRFRQAGAALGYGSPYCHACRWRLPTSYVAAMGKPVWRSGALPRVMSRSN